MCGVYAELQNSAMLRLLLNRGAGIAVDVYRPLGSGVVGVLPSRWPGRWNLSYANLLTE
jgi:hypothetical protein